MPHPTAPASYEQQLREAALSRFPIIPGNVVEYLPPPPWIVEDVLVKGSLVLFYGASGSGKSFIVSDLGRCVSTGRSWQGKEVLQGRVIHVVAEGLGDLGERHRAARIAHGADSLTNVGCVITPVDLSNDQEVKVFVAALQTEPPILVTIDTLARCMGGADENVAKDMNRVIKNVDLIRTETGAAVLLVHHSGHNKARERGSSVLKGAADTVIKISGKVTTSVAVTCDKMKMAPEFEPINLSFEASGNSLVVVSTGVTLDLSDKERASLMLVSQGGLTYTDWWEGFMAGDHGSKSSFDRARNTLCDKGLVESSDDSVYSITDLGREAAGVTGVTGVSSTP